MGIEIAKSAPPATSLSLSSTPYPTSKTMFREKDINAIYQCVQSGESAQILGVSGIGKSNLFNHVLEPDHIADYFQTVDAASRPILVRVNFHYAVDFTPRSIYSLMLEPFETLHSEDAGEAAEALRQQMVAHHNDLLEVGDDLLQVQRIFRRAIRLVMQNRARKLFFLFDQFDTLLKEAPPRFFANLRGLREEFKYRLGFIIFSQRPLSELIPDEDPDYDEFIELVSGRTLGLTPHTRPDADEIVKRISGRNNLALDPELHAPFYKLSGGHGGLHRATILAYIEAAAELGTGGDQSGETDKILDPNLLISHHNIQNECRKIWNSFSPEEQTWLQTQVKGKSSAAGSTGELVSAVSLLKLKGVLRPDGTLFSPLLARFIHNKKDYTHALEFDSNTKQIWVYGDPLEKELTPTEFKIFELLYDNVGLAVSNEEIIKHVWGDAGEYAYRDGKNNLRTSIYRLRLKIGPSNDRQKFIANATSGSGYILKLD